jgi:hypothetical protein
MNTYAKCAANPCGMRTSKIIGLKASCNEYLQKNGGRGGLLLLPSGHPRDANSKASRPSRKLAFPVTSALLVRSFAKERKLSRFFSIGCALFREKCIAWPKNRSQPLLIPNSERIGLFKAAIGELVQPRRSEESAVGRKSVPLMFGASLADIFSPPDYHCKISSQAGAFALALLLLFVPRAHAGVRGVLFVPAREVGRTFRDLVTFRDPLAGPSARNQSATAALSDYRPESETLHSLGNCDSDQR